MTILGGFSRRDMYVQTKNGDLRLEQIQVPWGNLVIQKVLQSFITQKNGDIFIYFWNKILLIFVNCRSRNKQRYPHFFALKLWTYYWITQGNYYILY